MSNSGWITEEKQLYIDFAFKSGEDAALSISLYVSMDELLDDSSTEIEAMVIKCGIYNEIEASSILGKTNQCSGSQGYKMSGCRL